MLALLSLGSASATPLDQLIQRLEGIRQQEGIAGLGLVITEANKVRWSGALGIRDWDSQQPIDDSTYIRIGSVTKMVTALAFLRLQQQGRLAIDSPIKRWVDPPPYNNPWADQHPVTIAQTLEHTAGLTDLVQQEWDHNQPLPLAQALALAPASRQLRWPPGLHNSYSNSGAGIAAFTMQQATGLAFEQYVQDQVFKPLHMTSATFDLSELVQTELATGYNRDGRSPIPYWHTLYRPFGGANIRIRDMAPLLQMLLSRGRRGEQRFLSPALIERLETPHTTLAARSGLKFGYGLGNYAYLHRGFVLHGHGGDADGYLCHMGYSLDSGLGYFLVINAFRNSSLRKLRRQVENYLVADLKPNYQPGQPQKRADLQALSGQYEAVTWRFPGRSGKRRARIDLADDGRLYMHLEQDKQALIPLGNGHFRRSFEPVATITFVTHDDVLYLQGPFGNFRRLPEDSSN